MPNENLQPDDALQLALEAIFGYMQAKGFALQGTKPKAAEFYRSSGRAAGRALLPASYAYEALKNTKDGWGNAVEDQRAFVEDNPFKGAVAGVSSPLTVFANIGSSIKDYAEGQAAVSFLEPMIKAQMEHKAKFKAFGKQNQDLNSLSKYPKHAR